MTSTAPTRDKNARSPTGAEARSLGEDVRVIENRTDDGGGEHHRTHRVAIGHRGGRRGQTQRGPARQLTGW